MLAQFYPPTIGGDEQHVRSLNRGFVARGHDVADATLWKRGLSDFEVGGGVRKYRIRGATGRTGWLFAETERRNAPPFPDPEAVWALHRVVARERPEVVHDHNWLVQSYLPLKIWSEAKLIISLHDYSLLCAQKRLMNHGAPCNGPGLKKCLSCAAHHYRAAKGIGLFLATRR